MPLQRMTTGQNKKEGRHAGFVEWEMLDSARMPRVQLSEDVTPDGGSNELHGPTRPDQAMNGATCVESASNVAGERRRVPSTRAEEVVWCGVGVGCLAVCLGLRVEFGVAVRDVVWNTSCSQPPTSALTNKAARPAACPPHGHPHSLPTTRTHGRTKWSRAALSMLSSHRNGYRATEAKA